MLTTDKKIHVSIPCLGEIKAETVASMLGFVKATKYDHTISINRNTYIHYARNKAVVEAVEQNATHLMFIDADMSFDPRGVDTLVERELDIVGGLYFGRVTPFPVAKVKHPTLNAITNPIKIPDEPVFQVEAVGTGFMLINMDVFKSMEPPFFFHSKHEDWGLDSHPFPHDEVGEDVSFCLKARKGGYEINVDQSIRIGHVGENTATRDSFDSWIKKEREDHAKRIKEEQHQIQ